LIFDWKEFGAKIVSLLCVCFMSCRNALQSLVTNITGRAGYHPKCNNQTRKLCWQMMRGCNSKVSGRLKITFVQDWLTTQKPRPTSLDILWTHTFTMKLFSSTLFKTPVRLTLIVGVLSVLGHNVVHSLKSSSSSSLRAHKCLDDHSTVVICGGSAHLRGVPDALCCYEGINKIPAMSIGSRIGSSTGPFKICVVIGTVFATVMQEYRGAISSLKRGFDIKLYRMRI
jgi:hypothetical protein